MASLPNSQTVTYEEMWVVSPEARTVEVRYLENGFLRRAQALTQGVLEPKHFPGVQIHIAEIWPD
jgi:Uma2 family endonuclease